MKLPLSSLALLASAILSLQAEDAVIAATTARIDGNIPDGTPPPPEPPKPKFSVRSRDILKSETHRQGGRNITIQQIAPIPLPIAPATKKPAPITDPVILERLAELRRNRPPKEEVLFIGATIFRSGDTATTLVRLQPEGQGEPIVFWSSADFALLSGMSSFIGSDGVPRTYLMAWSNESLDRPRNNPSAILQSHGVSEIPDLPNDHAAFVILTGNPSPEALVSIQSIHDLINNDHARLQAAYTGREHARQQAEADLKAHPPKPRDLVLGTWRVSDNKAPAIKQKGAVAR
jgi:hypothetical protein